MSNSIPGSIPTTETAPLDWHADSSWRSYAFYVPRRPSARSLLLACALFLVTLCTCLIAGTHFAIAYAHDEAVSWDEFIGAFTLIYRHPLALAAGLPFALTLLTILLVHELGHFFACRHHHIHSSYPFFIPFPTLIGTLGAFILIRSPIRNTRALFDVGASGPLVGFLVAVPALIYGIVHAKFIPGLSLDGQHGSDFLPRPSIFFRPRNWTAATSFAQSASTLIASPLSFSRCSWHCWDFAIGPAGICGLLC